MGQLNGWSQIEQKTFSPHILVQDSTGGITAVRVAQCGGWKIHAQDASIGLSYISNVFHHASTNRDRQRRRPTVLLRISKTLN